MGHGGAGEEAYLRSECPTEEREGGPAGGSQPGLAVSFQVTPQGIQGGPQVELEAE